MAIETSPEKVQGPSGGAPAGVRPPRAWWRRPAMHTAVAGAVIGYVLGHLLGNFLGSGYQQLALSDSSDLPIVLGYLLAIVGWLGGLGVFNDLARQIAGRPAAPSDPLAQDEITGLAKYFRYSLDHKVVGLQYLVGMIIYFCTAGLFAMAIRTELLSPTQHVFTSQAYAEIVGEHGTMMMMLMTSVILGPFGNYLVPLMIGSKRVAFPRIEALSFWLTPCAFLILLSGLLLGGFPFGWTGYAPLSIQATVGADSYAIAFGLMGISMILAGFNIIITTICYRAPGMRWSRLPMFVWSMVATSFLMVLAAPVLVGGMYMIITDRTAQTAFFEDSLGGSSYLFQNVFWFFGHPEVYILAL
ncbi:MAG: cbb3-type cytochrome c oxidase subunit I, partial [Actinomycetota bacterium]|nr:cbb3-type cytochrome c oxidase subunit I [Actinomycetota bacterium]